MEGGLSIIMKCGLLKRGWAALLAVGITLGMAATPLTALATAEDPFMLTQQQGEEEKENNETAGDVPQVDENQEEGTYSANPGEHVHTGDDCCGEEVDAAMLAEEQAYFTSPEKKGTQASGQLQIAPMSGGLTRANDFAIDASDLRDWITYDHYWVGEVASVPTQTSIGEYSNQNILTYDSAIVDTYGNLKISDADWAARFTDDFGTPIGDHPYYPFKEAYFGPQNEEITVWDGKSVEYRAVAQKPLTKVSKYTLSYNPRNADESEKVRVYDEVLEVLDNVNGNCRTNHGTTSDGKTVYSSTLPTSNAFSQHIFSQGTPENATITFMGYGYGNRYYTDFALAPIDTPKTKSVIFDIDCEKINSHTLNSFGFLLNAGLVPQSVATRSSSMNFVGYALAIDPNMNVYLIDLSKGIDVDAMHHNSTFLMTSQTKEDSLGQVPKTGMIRVSLTVRPNEITVIMSGLDRETEALAPSTSPKLNGTQSITLKNPTGHNYFGPFASYNGSGHSCSRLSWVNFTRLSMGVDYDVIYNNNPPAASAITDDIVAKYKVVAEDDMGVPVPNPTLIANGVTQHPAPPQDIADEGYVFVGWSTSKTTIETAPGLRDLEFKLDQTITGQQQVYAIWAAPSIEVISYTPSTFTNQEVTGIVEILSPVTPKDVVVKVKYSGGTVEIPVTNIQQDPTNSTRYTGEFKTKDNIPKGSTVEAKIENNSVAGFVVINNDVLVDWIDKNDPKIELPPTGAVIDGNSVKVYDDPTVTEKDCMSDIDVPRTLITATSIDGLGIVTGTTWAAVYPQLRSGRYNISVETYDKAGNTAKDEVKNVIVDEGEEADFIVLDVKYTPTTWTNGDVKVDVTVTSPLPITMILIDGASVAVTAGSAPDTYVGATVTMTANKNPFAVRAETAKGSFKEDANCKVTWIDKEAPTFDNFPNKVASGGVVVAADMSAITATDPASPNANVGGATFSGVNASTRELWLYKVNEATGIISTTPIKIKWADIASTWPTLASGDYYYDVLADDNVTNHGQASKDFGLIGAKDPDPKDPPGPEPGGKDPKDPTDPPIVINPSGPSIVETGRTPNKTWVNFADGGNVDIDFEAKANANIDKVVVTGPDGYSKTYTAGTPMDKIMNDTFNVTVNGSYVMTVTDKTGKTATATSVVNNIDKTIPTATGVVDGASLDDVAFDDPTGSEKGTPSGIDHTNTIITATPVGGGSAVTGPFNTVLASLPSGDYDVVIVVKDVAGNEQTYSADGMTHISGNEKMVVRIISYDPPQSAGYTNQDVKVKYEAVSPLNIKELKENGTAVAAAVGQKSHQGTITYTENGNVLVEANTTNVKVSGNDSGTVTWIDKLKPVITNNSTGTTIQDVALAFSDQVEPTTLPPSIPKNATSEVNHGKTAVTLVDKATSAATTVTANASDADSVATLERALASAKSGRTYRIYVYIEDYATNCVDDSVGVPFAGAGEEIGEFENPSNAGPTVTLVKGDAVLNNARFNTVIDFAVTGNGNTFTVKQGATTIVSGISAPDGAFALRLNAANGFTKGKSHTITFYASDGTTKLAEYTFKVS